MAQIFKLISERDSKTYTLAKPGIESFDRQFLEVKAMSGFENLGDSSTAAGRLWQSHGVLSGVGLLEPTAYRAIHIYSKSDATGTILPDLLIQAPTDKLGLAAAAQRWTPETDMAALRSIHQEQLLDDFRRATDKIAKEGNVIHPPMHVRTHESMETIESMRPLFEKHCKLDVVENKDGSGTRDLLLTPITESKKGS